MGDALKSSFEVAMQVTRWRGGVGGRQFYGEVGLSLCNTTVLKLFRKSYWVL